MKGVFLLLPDQHSSSSLNILKCMHMRVATHISLSFLFLATITKVYECILLNPTRRDKIELFSVWWATAFFNMTTGLICFPKNVSDGHHHSSSHGVNGLSSSLRSKTPKIHLPKKEWDTYTIVIKNKKNGSCGCWIHIYLTNMRSKGSKGKRRRCKQWEEYFELQLRVFWNYVLCTDHLLFLLHWDHLSFDRFDMHLVKYL